MTANAAFVASPKDAVAPLSGAETPNRIGPAGMGGNCDAALPLDVGDVATGFFDELLQPVIARTPHVARVAKVT
ncbi:MAG TPA: hypothetical protein VKQ71_13440 [Acidimicrobiales bacterium]|nr:hypothetical protein [Acidimicrobiales bacterium]